MFKFVNLFLFATLFIGCSLFKSPYNDISEAEFFELDKEFEALLLAQSPEQRAKKHAGLLESIDKYIGTKKGGDCSGFITVLNNEHKSVFFDNNELNKFYTNKRKTQAIFNYYRNKKRLSNEKPQIGDLVFFQNTLRTNKHKINGEISHIGVIREIYPDGRIRFVHNTRGKNKSDYMNLNKKNTHLNGKKIENSYIVVCKNGDKSCLTSNRFAGFGKVN